MHIVLTDLDDCSGHFVSHVFFMNRISLPLMDSIETSPKIHCINSATLPRATRPHTGDNSDSDSESDTAPLGDTFITRYSMYTMYNYSLKVPIV